MTTGIVVVEVPESVLVIEEDESTVIVEEQISIVEVTSGGAQGGKGDTGVGEKGDKGDKGDEGDAGVPGAGFNYIHTQSIPNTIWVIDHNLNGFPNVSTVDTNSPPEQIEGVVKYVSPNTIWVEFSFSIGGQAYLS